MKKDIAVKLTNISKKYIVHHEKPTFVERLMNGRGEEFYALKNMNLTINKGERVGIIGANGSGKTTLLKIITRIATPTKGKVETYGKVVSLIDLEAGFHPDLTGIQNIYLNGTILGLSKKEINERLDNIINFAGIGKFIDAPLFTYSSGMMLRLGFSVAIYSNPDTLVLDESLAVGDLVFREKSSKKIYELLNMGKTLIVASHDTFFLKNICKRVIWLKSKTQVIDGKPKEVIDKYENG